jgi:hypothetical protein
MKAVIVLGATIVLLASGPFAHAVPACPAAYQHPARAKLMKASLVQAFISCGGLYNPPNATTETGTVPSCYPAETFHQQAGSPPHGWEWGPRSSGTITFKAGKNKLFGSAYPLNTDPDAVDLSIQLKMSGLYDNTGVADGTVGHLVLVGRATIIDRAHDQVMTVIDFPLGETIQVHNGTVAKKTSVTTRLNALMQPALPHCTSIELVAVQVNDPNGSPFAVIGAYLP